ncbi:MAG: hypothetical protein ACXVCY_03735 [Pseudobdellovibrionaceae bacterium]
MISAIFKIGVIHFLLFLSSNLMAKPYTTTINCTNKLLCGGESSRGGGGGVSTSHENTFKFLDLAKISTKIILTPSQESGYLELKNIMNSMSVFQNTTYIPMVATGTNSFTMKTAEKILSALNSLKFYLIPGPLPELNDKGTIILKKEFEGRVEQLAIQDINTNRVFVDRDLYKRMTDNSSFDVAAFFLHESLIRYYYNCNPRNPLTSTESIGNFVNVIFDPIESRKITVKTFVQYLNEMGIPTARGLLLGYKLMTPSADNYWTVVNDFALFRKQEGDILFYLGQNKKYEISKEDIYNSPNKKEFYRHWETQMDRTAQDQDQTLTSTLRVYTYCSQFKRGEDCSMKQWDNDRNIRRFFQILTYDRSGKVIFDLNASGDQEVQENYSFLIKTSTKQMKE